MSIILRIIPVLIILFFGYWGYHNLFSLSDKEKAEQAEEKPSRKGKRGGRGGAGGQRASQQTTVMTLTAKPYEVHLKTQGVVRARIVTSLTPLVSGTIVEVTDRFQDGAFFEKGDVLVKLDREDYESQIITSDAALARAEAALAQEKARAAQALRNWEDIGFVDKPNDLVLRKPQLKEAHANVAAQQAALDRAKRSLERTVITAPFAGRVSQRSAGLGQSVSTGTQLGDIYATDYAEVRLPLSAKQLTMINIDEMGNQEIPVELMDALNSDNKMVWNASVRRVEGELDKTSRELFVIAQIKDPFGIHHGPHSDKSGSAQANAPLRINQPVLASIVANTIENAYVIDRKSLYGADEILLINDDKIERRSIDIIWSTEDSIIVTDADLEGKVLATSRLSYANTGTPVEIIESDKPTTNKEAQNSLKND